MANYGLDAQKEIVSYLDHGNIAIQNAVICWPCFAGEQDESSGRLKRHFTLVLSEPIAKKLSDDKWNVKFYEPKDERFDGYYHTDINVNPNSTYPPRITQIISKEDGDYGINLPVEQWGKLDNMNFEYVDLIIHGYDYSHTKRASKLFKYKGYLTDMKFKADDSYEVGVRNAFGGKYAHLKEYHDDPRANAVEIQEEEDLPF